MRNRARLCLAAALVISVAFVFESRIAPRAAHAQAVVRVPEANCAFVPPPGYKRIQRKAIPPEAQQAAFLYVGPSTAGFASNINLVVQAAPPGLKADLPAAESVGVSLKGVFPTYKKVGAATMMVGGEKAVFVSGTFSSQGHSVQNKQVLVIHGGKGYVFTLTAAASAFRQQVGAFDKMVASIKWL